jgi:hypothetical protein
MTRARGFLVVLHDVHKGTQAKADVIEHLKLKEPTQAVVALEPYEHQEGLHIHIFYRLASQSDFKAQLKHWALWYKAGRVQVDVMRGEMAQACRYLLQDMTKKDKQCDPEPWFYPSKKIVLSPAEYADKWLDDWLLPGWGLNYPQQAYQTAWTQAMSESKIKCTIV